MQEQKLPSCKRGVRLVLIKLQEIGMVFVKKSLIIVELID